MATGGVQHFQDDLIPALNGDFNKMSHALAKHLEKLPEIVVLVVTSLRYMFCSITGFLDHDVKHSGADLVTFAESLDKLLRREVAGQAESGFREFWFNLISHVSNSYKKVNSQNYASRQKDGSTSSKHGTDTKQNAKRLSFSTKAPLPPLHSSIMKFPKKPYSAKNDEGIHLPSSSPAHRRAFTGSMTVDASRRASGDLPKIQQEPVKIKADCRNKDLNTSCSYQPPARRVSYEKYMGPKKQDIGILMKYGSQCVTRSLDGNVILIGKGDKIIICTCDGKPNPDWEPIDCGGMVFDAAWIRDDCLVAVVKVDSKFEVITLTDLKSDEPTRVILKLYEGAVPQGITQDENWLYVCDVGNQHCLHRFGIEDLNHKDEIPLEHGIRPHKVGSNNGHIIVTDITRGQVLVIEKVGQELGAQQSYDIKDIIGTDAASIYFPTGVYCGGNTILTLNKVGNKSTYIGTDSNMNKIFAQVLNCKDPTGVVVTKYDVSIVSASDDEPMGATRPSRK